jgi:hypothetical protein
MNADAESFKAQYSNSLNMLQQSMNKIEANIFTEK